jgi:hypothetical protein
MTAESSSTPPTLGLVLPSPLVELHDESLASREVRVFLKRDDLIHPELPGNKWRKLKYNLEAAGESGQHTLSAAHTRTTFAPSPPRVGISASRRSG